MIIPEDERSNLPLNDENVIHHPDMLRANQWIIEEYSVTPRKLCIFVPCSKKKPYHTSPSHQIFDQLIYSLLQPEEVHIVTFGTCGVVPRELDTEYPFMHYSFMLGKCNVAKIKAEFHKIESERLSRYLKKTKHTYQHRIAYCIGDFREAMKRATELSGIHVTLAPREETMKALYQPEKAFKYRSLCCIEYLQDLADAITDTLNLPRKKIIKNRESTDDTEWYIL
jgi:predicted RNA-binding protein